MRNIQFGVTFLMLVSFATAAFTQDLKKNGMKLKHKVVMQVTEGDSLTQLAVIGQVRNIRKQLPDAQIEVVCHANSLDMLLKSGTKVASHIAELTSQEVRFVACENTMARKKATKEDLVPGTETVPSGLVEIILKQEEGWSYIKGGH
ncbi:MAG: DsrE family protein [Chryseosolibacter sp.]